MFAVCLRSYDVDRGCQVDTVSVTGVKTAAILWTEFPRVPTQILSTFILNMFIILRPVQGITFEKARRVTNRSLKMTIWSLGSDLCNEEKVSARGRHYNTIRQGAPFYHYLSGRRHFNTTTRSM